LTLPGRQERIHIHHEPGCAETTLRTVVFCDPVLYRAELAAAVAGSFGGGDLHAIQRTEGSQAGVDREVLNLLPRLIPTRQHHSAGAATALRAALLCAGQTYGGGSHPVHQQDGGIYFLDDDLGSV